MTCKSPRTLLFNDIPSDEEADKLITQMQHQPGMGWELNESESVDYYGWQNGETETGYLVCERDAIFPPEVQRMLAQSIGSSNVQSCEAGHMPQASSPEAVAAFIEKSATA